MLCSVIISISGLVNVPIEHHPTIGDINSNRYLKVIFKIPKKGHLPTPVYLMITYMITIIPINFIEPLLKSPITILVGGFNPSEKYESQLGVLFPILYIYIWKNAIHVPKHQPVMVILPGMMIKPLEWLSYGYKKCSKPPTSYPCLSRFFISVSQAPSLMTSALNALRFALRESLHGALRPERSERGVSRWAQKLWGSPDRGLPKLSL